MFTDPDFDITPEEFELEVKGLLESAGAGLSELEAVHREIVPGTDGNYEIDITARFEALGANFLVAIECKRHKNRIKRDVVQVLHSRLQAIGAHKEMNFATAGLQKGAIEFAQLMGLLW